MGPEDFHMKRHIYWLCVFRINPADLPAFKAVVAPLVAETRKEAGSMAYEYHVTQDHTMTRSPGQSLCSAPKKADRLKLPYWDGTGLMMAYKRLEEQAITPARIRSGATRNARRGRRSAMAAATGAHSGRQALRWSASYCGGPEPDRPSGVCLRNSLKRIIR